MGKNDKQDNATSEVIEKETAVTENEPPIEVLESSPIENTVSEKTNDSERQETFKNIKEAAFIEKDITDKKTQDSQMPYSPARSVELFLIEGIKSMDKTMAVLQESKSKANLDKTPNNEDYEIMKKVKDGYIKNLKFLMENSPSFGDSYTFGNKELEEVDRGLEIELKKYFVR